MAELKKDAKMHLLLSSLLLCRDQKAVDDLGVQHVYRSAGKEIKQG